MILAVWSERKYTNALPPMGRMRGASIQARSFLWDQKKTTRSKFEGGDVDALAAFFEDDVFFKHLLLGGSSVEHDQDAGVGLIAEDIGAMAIKVQLDLVGAGWALTVLIAFGAITTGDILEQSPAISGVSGVIRAAFSVGFVDPKIDIGVVGVPSERDAQFGLGNGKPEQGLALFEQCLDGSAGTLGVCGLISEQGVFFACDGFDLTKAFVPISSKQDFVKGGSKGVTLELLHGACKIAKGVWLERAAF